MSTISVVVPIDGTSKYSGTFLCVDYIDQDNWMDRIHSLVESEIITRNTLMINTDTSTQGMIDLVSFAGSYTP